MGIVCDKNTVNLDETLEEYYVKESQAEQILRLTCAG